MSAKLYGVSIVAVLALAVSQFAHGQQAAQTQAVSAGDLTEIIVTARRVEERAQDVPISMTIFNQSTLRDRNVQTSGDLAAITPSVSLDSEFGQDLSSFSIRGFVQTLNSTPSVAVYFADAVGPRGGNVGISSGSGIPSGSFFDLDNIEVLKGPQGTLFGRNTDGGAVLVVPKKPTSDFEGYVEGGLGNYQMHEIQGVLNLPLGPNVRLRLAVNDETRNGYVDSVTGIGPSQFDNLDYTAARLSLVVDVTPNLENYTVGAYNLSVNNGDLPQAFACNYSGGPASAGATLCPATLGALAGKGPYAVAGNFEGAESYLKQLQIINTTTWHPTDALTIKNIANYGELVNTLGSGLFGGYVVPSPLGGYAPISTSTDDPRSIGAKTTDQYTWTDELQFSGNALDNKFNWQGGGYIERSGPLGDLTGSRSANFIYCPDAGALICAGPGDVDQNTSRFHWFDEAFFGQATYQVFDQFKVTGGFRYTWDRTEATVNSINWAVFPPLGSPPGTYTPIPPGVIPQLPTGNPFCTSAFTTVASNCYNAYEQSSHAPTGVVDFDYTPTPDQLVYAKYSKGYRQGGVAPFVADGYHTYDPEHVDSYEVGEKHTFSGPIKGTFDVTGHYNNFTDQQLLAGFIGPLAAPSSGVLNAGKSRIWGIELESTVQPVEPLTLGVSYSYLNTKLLSAFTQLPPGGAYTTIEFPTTPGGVLPFSPKNKLSANASYRLPLPDDVGKVSVGANYTYTSSMLISTTAAPYDTLDGYGLIGADLHWDSIARSPVDLEGFVTNLANKVYYNNLTQIYATTFGLASRYLGEPRMYGVRVRVRFGKAAGG
jgi:iron complex outermembrane receptor protein